MDLGIKVKFAYEWAWEKSLSSGLMIERGRHWKYLNTGKTSGFSATTFYRVFKHGDPMDCKEKIVDERVFVRLATYETFVAALKCEYDYLLAPDDLAGLNYLEEVLKDPEHNYCLTPPRPQSPNVSAFQFLTEFEHQGFGRLKLTEELLQDFLDHCNSWNPACKAKRASVVMAPVEAKNPRAKGHEQNSALLLQELIENKIPQGALPSIVIGAFAIYLNIRPSSILHEGSQERIAVKKFEDHYFANQ